MQTIDTMLSPALDPVKDEWDFLEVWIDPMQSPPYLLMLMGDLMGVCRVCDPVENYKVVLTRQRYEEAQLNYLNWKITKKWQLLTCILRGKRLLSVSINQNFTNILTYLFNLEDK